LKEVETMRRQTFNRRWIHGIAVFSLVAVFGFVGVGCDESESTDDLLGNTSALAGADAVGDLSGRRSSEPDR
jgi:hypothetical protein